MFGKIKIYNRWGFLQIEHDVGRYYRSLFKLTFGLKLERPSNKEHITIVQPEDGVELRNCRKYDGNILHFSCLTNTYTNGSAYWIDVISDDIINFRKSLGLGEMYIPLHLCIGYDSCGKL